MASTKSLIRGRLRSHRPGEEIEFDFEAVAKGAYDHFMLKEIFEQPQALVELHTRSDS